MRLACPIRSIDAWYIFDGFLVRDHPGDAPAGPFRGPVHFGEPSGQGPEVTIRGAGPAATILDGMGSASVFDVLGGSVVLTDMTITNAAAGIHLRCGAGLVVERCLIHDNGDGVEAGVGPGPVGPPPLGQ